MCDTTEYIPYVLCDDFFGDTAMSKIDLTARTAPGTPTSGRGTVYFSSVDKKLHVRDDAGSDLALGVGGDGASPFVVDAGGATAYATLQPALDAAHAAFSSSGREQVVYVRPGTYTENLVFKPGVSLTGLAEYAPTNPPIASPSPATVVVGEHVITEALGAIRGSVRNLAFKMPAAGVNSPACLIQYGAGGSPAGPGSFQFTNCLFDQSAGTFDEAVLRTVAASSAADTIAFHECAFWINTPAAVVNFDVVSGAGAPPGVFLTFDRCGLFSSVNFNGSRKHVAAVRLSGGDAFATVVGSVFSGVTFSLAGAGTSFLMIEDSEMVTQESGTAFVTSANSGNRLRLDNTSLTLNGAAHAVEGPVELETGLVSLTGFTTDNFAANVTLSTTHARLYRGAHQGGTLYVATSPGPTTVPTSVVGVDVETSAGLISIQLPSAEELQGAHIVVRDASNAANTHNITVLGALDASTGSGTQDTISKQGQVVTYTAMNVGGAGAKNWMWVRSGAIK